MAVVYATKNGNWTDTTVWNTGGLPTSSDDVYSNNFTVTVNTSPTVLSLRTGSSTGVTAGGKFSATNGMVLTCTGGGLLAAGGINVPVIEFNLSAGQSCTVNSNIFAGSAIQTWGANIVASSGGTITINGNITGGGVANAYGLNINTCTATINITGTITGGTNAAGTGILAVGGSNCTLNLTGQTIAGSGAALNITNGNINITGDVYSVTNAGPNTTITGGIYGGFSYGLTNTGTVTHIGGVYASTSSPAIAPGSIGQITVLTGPLVSTDGSGGTAAAAGVNPCVALRWFPADTALGTFEYRMRGQTAAGSPSVRPARQLFLTDAYAAGYPSATNVRSATTYGPGSIYTGTCAVPAAASVVVGVAVDATVGTAAVTAASIRSALGLASANLDTQLSAIPTAAAPSASTIASAVWSAATRTITTTIPTAADIATAVWAAATRTLTTAIDNSTTIATAVWGYASGRTITGGTVDTLTNAPTVPTAEEIAAEVRTELAPELARVSNCATVESTGDQIVALIP